MNKLFLIIAATFFGFSISAQNGNYKVFPFKSGIVKYTLDGNSKGTHTKYFDDYGYKQADYNETETTVFGFTNKEKSGTILIGPKVYAINYKTETVSVGVNPAYESYANSNGANYDKLGRDAMASLGFSNTNKTEQIAGKKCEIWKGSLGIIWVWKGLALKSETTVLGISIIETAISVKVNISIPESRFEIPEGIEIKDIPENTNTSQSVMGSSNISNQQMSPEEKQMMEDAMSGDMEGMMNTASSNMSQEEKDQILKMAKMSYPEFNKIIKQEEPNITEEEIKQAYQMMKQMAKYIK
ncbi:MAG: hypothetical protein KAG37_02710 [Flavobacteriales bacterium]|nr:hypothetical protein [Flavobacteriales bacterium]